MWNLRATPRSLGMLAAILLMGVGQPAGAGDRVVLASWDGVRRDVLHELLQWQPLAEEPVPCPTSRLVTIYPVECNGYQTCLPNLCRFQIIDSNDTEGKPLTRPQHAQMLTGYGPRETGEITNSGTAGVPPGLTIYERIAAARPEVRTVHVGGLKYIGQGVIHWATALGALNLAMRRGSRDQYTGENTTAQFQVGLDFIDGDPFFFFIHFKAADVVGHRAGARSNQYREAIMQNDAQLGSMLEILADYGVLDSTQVYVTTDHGFDGIFHTNINHATVSQTWIASSAHDLQPENARILDVAPTLLDALGIDTGNAEPPYRGHSLLVH